MPHPVFKNNDYLGVTTILTQGALLRATDLIARLDHNHFALGLFNIDEAGTEVVLNRIADHIQEFNQEFGKTHKLKIDYKLAACLCLPTQEQKIESIFNNVSKLSQELERKQQQSQALVKLQ
ncbi:nucleotidyl cyclase domain-containing protein [Shewanella xiamenensis]|uniref:Deoxycytidylate deaminase n=1 Tax=Shewanella xiamenensis TaxID=332186 RepID=A0AAE4TMX4_9GAMM|nr:deoxycytidylate deaminase [Shewanella xiamenensis]MDV5389769.1 deoxycytidylate deaminase [Shewanella xiamenensis]